MTIETLEPLIRTGLDNFAKTMHTALPGKIVSFDAATQLATVKPGVNYKLVSGDEIEMPELLKVPVVSIRGGDFAITLPVKADDECLIVFCETSIDRWKKDGNGKVATQKRYHDLSDGVAIVGLASDRNKLESFSTENAEIRSLDGERKVAVNGDGSVQIKTSTSTVEIAANGDINLQNEGGTFTIKNAGGYVIDNTSSGESLLSILQDTLDTLVTTTVMGQPFDNAAAFSALSTRLGNFTQ